jgi:hypothetical protein
MAIKRKTSVSSRSSVVGYEHLTAFLGLTDLTFVASLLILFLNAHLLRPCSLCPLRTRCRLEPSHPFPALPGTRHFSSSPTSTRPTSSTMTRISSLITLRPTKSRRALCSLRAAVDASGHLDWYFNVSAEIGRYRPLVRNTMSSRWCRLTHTQAAYVATAVQTARDAGFGVFGRRTVKTFNSPIESDVTLTNLRRPDLTTSDHKDKRYHKNFRYAGALWELNMRSSDAPDDFRHQLIIG